MNKTNIKNFAVWARQKLISDITYKAGMLGITDSGIAEKLPQSTTDLHFYDIGTKNYAEISGKEISQRSALVSAIRNKERDIHNYKEAFQFVVEEVAYTWFNRLIAIRFMEVNSYLPSGIRVLSSENKAKNEPDFVTTPFDTDLEFTPYEQDRVVQLKDENKLDELFRMLFIKQCNKLHDILPELFEKTDDYTELLLTISFTDKDGIVYRLIHDIDEDDFNIEKEGQVEIIGWMYQYYNIEPKEKVFSDLKNNIKVSKDAIPAATQIFTPDWIVHYMVENSLGRLWAEGHQCENIKTGWQYYVESNGQSDSVISKLTAIQESYKNLSPSDIKVIDPSMGSGHILVYAFDILMQIYESYGYTQRDAAISILENNIYGLDIDKRAYQLAYFAVMMKARQYNRRIFSQHIRPHLYSIEESNHIDKALVDFIANGDKAICKDITMLLEDLYDAKEYGSLANVRTINFEKLYKRIEEIKGAFYDNIFELGYQNEVTNNFIKLVNQAQTMSQKYDVIITNPPYMGCRNMNSKLVDYIEKNYPNSKTDMFSCFIERGFSFAKKNGFNCMVTMQSWMFLTGFEKFRKETFSRATIESLLHMDNMVMGIAFGTSATVFRNTFMPDYLGNYTPVNYADLNESGIPDKFPIEANNNSFASIDQFNCIDGSPVAYWLSDTTISAFNNKTLGDYAKPRQGMATSDNNRFLRYWFEVESEKICYDATDECTAEKSKCKWFPYNKGGSYRKWYGNNEYLLNWENNGLEVKALATKLYKCVTRTIKNIQFYFKKGITWSTLSSGNFSARYCGEGFLFDTKGSTCFFDDEEKIKYCIAFLNGKVATELLKVLAPTMDFNAGAIARLPVKYDTEKKPIIDELVQKCIDISKADWDAFETSWDFRKHPLVPTPREWQEQLNSQFAGTRAEAFSKLSWHYKQWEYYSNYRFESLKENEEELNRIFIEIYGLGNELTPDIPEKDVSVRRADLQRDIKSLLSYAVGCMFGRYSLDNEGVAYAGGEWDDSKYDSFIPDRDNCIPITDEEYFEDDIVGLLCAWLKNVYGEKTLEENLAFIANALGNKGSTSREIIRNYFLNDFIKDHIKIYNKRPIYWLFDSGKQNGFKALCYMHRWNADTIGNMRVEYLHRMQKVYDKEIERMQEVIDNSRDNREVSAASKRKEKLQKQIKETKDYDAMVAHLALSRINIDLDDGVKVNYEKVQTAPDGKKMQILTKI